MAKKRIWEKRANCVFRSSAFELLLAKDIFVFSLEMELLFSLLALAASARTYRPFHKANGDVERRNVRQWQRFSVGDLNMSVVGSWACVTAVNFNKVSAGEVNGRQLTKQKLIWSMPDLTLIKFAQSADSASQIEGACVWVRGGTHNLMLKLKIHVIRVILRRSDDNMWLRP